MPAYQPTLDFHRLIADDLPVEDGQDLADARHGFIGTTEHGEVLHPTGHTVWSMRGYGLNTGADECQ